MMAVSSTVCGEDFVHPFLELSTFFFTVEVEDFEVLLVDRGMDGHCVLLDDIPVDDIIHEIVSCEGGVGDGFADVAVGGSGEIDNLRRMARLVWSRSDLVGL